METDGFGLPTDPTEMMRMTVDEKLNILARATKILGQSQQRQIMLLEKRCEEMEGILDAAAGAFMDMTRLVASLAIRVMKLEGEDGVAEEMDERLKDFLAQAEEFAVKDERFSGLDLNFTDPREEDNDGS